MSTTPKKLYLVRVEYEISVWAADEDRARAKALRNVMNEDPVECIACEMSDRLGIRNP